MKKTPLQLVEVINNGAADLLTKIGELEQTIEDKDSEIEGLEEIVSDFESEPDGYILEDHQNNLRTSTCLEELFENIDRIPIQELEELVNKYKL